MRPYDLWSYVLAVWRHWVALVTGIVFALVGFGSAVGATVVSPWVWWALAFGFVCVAQFRAWLDTKRERDVVLREMAERFDSVKYSLTFDASLMNVKARRPDQLPAVQVGFSLRNQGDLPVQFNVTHMSVTLDGVTDPDPHFDTDGAVLPPHQGYAFWFPWFNDLEVRRGMKGTLDYTLHYGHPASDVRFQLEHLQELECIRTADDDGEWRIAVRDLKAPTVKLVEQP